MSLFSSFIIDPVVRHARRISGAIPQVGEGGAPEGVLSRANRSSTSPTPAIAPLDATVAHDEDAPQTEDGSPVIDRFRQYSPFIRRPRSAGAEDEGAGGHAGSLHEPPLSLSRRQTAPSTPISIPADVSMSSNPSRTLGTHFERRHLDSPPAAAPSTTTLQRPGSPGLDTETGAQHAPTMSEALPADDGMRHLRARIHGIRDLKITDAEKARMMHSLMTERYNFLRPTSPSSFVSHDRPFTPTSGQSVFSEVQISSPVSAASEVDPENPFNLRPGDTNPTYRRRSADHTVGIAGEDEDLDTFEEHVSLGCQHYKRNVKVQCYDCRRWYTCRHCHDAVEEDHNLNRVKTQNMLCMVCGTPQKAAEYCTQCGTQSACYYCVICKLWDNNSSKQIYHCTDCGICRRGEGLGKDYVHCKVCFVLLWIGLFADIHPELQCVHIHRPCHVS